MNTKKNSKYCLKKNEPYDYFKLIATDEFFTMLVTKINNYASKLLSNILEPKSRLRLWKDVTVPEIKTFFWYFVSYGNYQTKPSHRLLEKASTVKFTSFFKTHEQK